MVREAILVREEDIAINLTIGQHGADRSFPMAQSWC